MLTNDAIITRLSASMIIVLSQHYMSNGTKLFFEITKIQMQTRQVRQSHNNYIINYNLLASFLLLFHPTGTRGHSRCQCRRWYNYKERIWDNRHPPTWNDTYHVLTFYTNF